MAHLAHIIAAWYKQGRGSMLDIFDALGFRVVDIPLSHIFGKEKMGISGTNTSLLSDQPDFVKPAYGSRCFADIPSTIRYMLTGESQPDLDQDVLGKFNRQYDVVLFFFLDSFGWRFLQDQKAHPLVQRLMQNGKVSKGTSMFPSTTAAHVTAIHTGNHISQSGVYAWQYYEPQLDDIITPLLFSYAGTGRRDTLKPTEIDPQLLYPRDTLYHSLGLNGVLSYVLQHREYTPSTYSDIVFRGARTVPYITFREALVTLEHILKRDRKPLYSFLYFDKLDTVCHKHGPESPHVAAETEQMLTAMEQTFEALERSQQRNTLCIVAADHGQIRVQPKETLYLNQLSALADLPRMMKVNGRGDPIVPAGGPRSMFLHIEAEHMKEAQDLLTESLNGRVTVCTTEQMIREGYFGPNEPSQPFLDRVGDLVLLPHLNETVWWYVPHKYVIKYLGYHGGLAAEEMEIPLCFYEFD